MARRITLNIEEIKNPAGQTSLADALYINDDDSIEMAVYSNVGFSDNDIILVGTFGSEGAEFLYIKDINFGTDEDTSLPLMEITTSPRKDHFRDDSVNAISFDQIQIYHADTIDGAKTALTSATINPEQTFFIFDDFEHEIGFYFARYGNSVTQSVSAFSAALPVEGYGENTVGQVIDEVLTTQGVGYDDKLSQIMLFGALTRMLADVRGRLHRWSNNQSFVQSLGKLQPGSNTFALPDDIDTKHSNKSILQVQIKGTDPLKFKKRTEWEGLYRDAVNTKVSQDTALEDGVIYLEDTSDLNDAGTINVYNEAGYTPLEYTANNRVTNTLTLKDAASEVFTTGTNIWQGETSTHTGAPQFYTVYNELLHIFPLPSPQWYGRRLTLDYYDRAQRITTEGDKLDVDRYDMAYHYLMAFVRSIRHHDGVIPQDDPDYIQYQVTVERAKGTEVNSHKRRYAPRVFGVMYNRNRRR